MKNTFQPLQKNTTVRIIAPGAGSPLLKGQEPSNWDDLEKCCELLRGWGLNPTHSPQIFGELNSYYNFANSDEMRANDFVDAFASEAAIVWCFRGGYGSDRVLSHVIKNKFKPRSPKLFIGFSDVTNLHNYILSTWQWPTLHALTARQLGLNLVSAADVIATQDIIFGKKTSVTLPLIPLNAAASQTQTLEATIVGGNLTIIQTAAGTPWQTPLKNNILLIEEIGEAPYRVARIFQQFLANGYLQSAQAIILGDFLGEFILDADIKLVLQEFAEQCPLPVLHCAGIGHGNSNHPIPLGTATTLTLGAKPTLVANVS